MPPRAFTLVTLFAAALLFLAACDSSVDPFLGTDLPYTVWGLVNPKADTHSVRVFIIEDRFQLVRPDPIDARVSSTNLDTGQQLAWRDSVIELRDGDFRHVYWASFPVQHGESYRLEVERSDGIVSWAETTVPPPIGLEVLPPNLNTVTELLIPVMILGEPPSLPRIDVEYVAETVPQEGDTRPPTELAVVVSHAGDTTPVEGGHLLEFDLRSDFVVVREAFEANELSPNFIKLNDLVLQVHVGDSQWVSPTGVFDPEALVEPGVFSNVENGFGFFGAGYVESINWVPPLILLQRAGFTVPGLE